MKRLLALAVPLALAACQDATEPLAPADAETPAASLGQVEPQTAAIPDQYIVVFNERVADAPGLARRLVAANGGSLRFTYQNGIKGFAGKLPARAVEAIRNNPNVAYVEQDQVMHAVGTQTGAT